jgi:hypothetical protein
MKASPRFLYGNEWMQKHGKSSSTLDATGCQLLTLSMTEVLDDLVSVLI